MAENEYMSTAQAARLLNVGRDTVVRACRSGALPSIRVGPTYGVKAADALAWKAAHYHPTMIRRGKNARRRRTIRK